MRKILLRTLGLLSLCGPLSAQVDDLDLLSRLSVPPGFRVSLYAQDLGDARGMALSPEGELYVCDKSGGRVLCLPPAVGEGMSEAKVVLQDLHRPHSLAFHQGRLYVGETDRVSRFPRTDQRLSREDGSTVLELPGGGGHHTRTILFGPDGKLYVSIGSTCNVCEEADERRATICRADPSGANFEVFARGLRNTVGMAFRPGVGELWASSHGRDNLGDDLPPECFYRVQKGKHYGWPYSYSHKGKVVPDPDLGNKGVRQTGLPVLEYQAHSAPLGLTFYTGEAFPPAYRQGFFTAFHGSWNRSAPTGYKVVFVPIKADGTVGHPMDFLHGFLEGRSRFGRPVDVLTGPTGELFVSDDHRGRIYRVTYEGTHR